MTKEVLMSLMIIFILLYAALLPAAHSAEQTAFEKEYEQRLNIQVIEVTKAKYLVLQVEAENAARLERTKAEVLIQRSRLDGMCEAAMLVEVNLSKDYCK